MISRRKIISRSQSELDYNHYEVEEDIWFNQDKLFQDHITEILRKWDQIDDEIWGKVICMERNRRIAKAYSRVPVLTICGSEDGFDGYKIGLNGFDNPMRDSLTKTVKTHIGKGVRLKMDDMGNIIIKRMSNCDVFIRGWDRENNSLSKEIVELSGELEFEKSVKLFDMKKFQASTARELRSAYPDRRKLENQCICAIAFVKDSPDVLDLCSWILLINIVALDLLKSRFPAIAYNRVGCNGPLDDQHLMIPSSGGSRGAPKFMSVFEPLDHHHHHLPPHHESRHRESRSISDEDPYSVPQLQSSSGGSGNGGVGGGGVGGGGVGENGRPRGGPGPHGHPDDLHNNVDPRKKPLLSSSSSPPERSQGSQKPPELPPRDFAKIKKSKGKVFPKALKSLVSNGKNSGPGAKGQSKDADNDHRPAPETRARSRDEIEYEDPYYCGLQARVPNFGGRQRKSIAAITNNINPSHYNNNNNSSPYVYHQRGDLQPHHPHPVSSSTSSGHNNHHFQQHLNQQEMSRMKSQSNGYLNSLFNQSSNFHLPKHLQENSKKNHSSSTASYPYYDSSLDSDAYGGVTSGSGGGGYDIYAPLNTQQIYGRLRAQIPTVTTAAGMPTAVPTKIPPSSAAHASSKNAAIIVSSNNNNNNNNHHPRNKRSSQKENQEQQQQQSQYTGHTQRYATEWD